jgi:hypothetical protein
MVENLPKNLNNQNEVKPVEEKLGSVEVGKESLENKNQNENLSEKDNTANKEQEISILKDRIEADTNKLNAIRAELGLDPSSDEIPSLEISKTKLKNMEEEWKKHLEEVSGSGMDHNDMFRTFLDKQEDGLPKSYEVMPNYLNYKKSQEGNQKMYPGIPSQVFDEIKSDLDNLPENNEILKFNKGQILELAINSNNTVRYQIFEATKGHYFIGKFDPVNPNTAPKMGEYFTSKEKKTAENPDLIVCSSKELEQWLKK